MTIKKTIALQEDVFIIANKKAKIKCNGNFSNYINSLLYDINKDEINKLQQNKPKKNGVEFKAIKTSTCEYCKETINIGDKICNAKFPDEHISYTHVNCCKE